MQNEELELHDSNALGEWLATLSRSQWIEGLDWLDNQMSQEATSESSWNDHWNNHVRFCTVVEAYLTLCYAIKWGDIGLLQDAMREICVIFQAPCAKKPKYAKEMLRQLHILDTGAADPILCKAYLANALVNPRGLPHTFYEMDLLLEHQNGNFKRFRADRGSSLQDTDELFRLHALSVNTLTNVRQAMNRTIIGRDRSGKHPTKSAAFDILSLADQLYRSKSTSSGGPEHGKVYFSENPTPDLLLEGLIALLAQTEAFNGSLERNSTAEVAVYATEDGVHSETAAQASRENEIVNEMFEIARESDLTSDLAQISI